MDGQQVGVDKQIIYVAGNEESWEAGGFVFNWPEIRWIEMSRQK